MRRLSLWLAVVLLAFVAPAATAHLTPNSEVNIDFGQSEIVADVIIPQGEYAFATGHLTDNSAAALSTAAAYLAQHIRVTTPAGAPWSFAIERIEFAQIAGPPDLHAIVRLVPPRGADARRMRVTWSAVIDRVPGHFVLFVARSDFSAGKLDEEREILGALQGERRVLAIDRGQAQPGKGFRAAITLGMRHIAEGHDHLLFLIALLLPAPMLAARRRWAGLRPARDMAWTLTAIVSAFTIGHSLTLVGSAFFGWQLPAQPVEIGIAVSILISAIHAWRPLFPGREPIVAAAFGLVHGLAFATIVSRFGLGVPEKAASILGFNIGIEIVQLCVVAAVLPLLFMLSRTCFYTPFRSIGAAGAGVAALAWIIERVTGSPNPVAAGIDAALAQAPWLVAALTVAAGIAYASQRRIRPVNI